MVNTETLIWCIRCNQIKTTHRDDIVMRTALRLTPDGPIPYGVCSHPHGQDSPANTATQSTDDNAFVVSDPQLAP